ncbi:MULTISPECIES: hypothetical protein [unclassified Campylobacter]|uniref:hypothetical protein n=1 Tax=unclassified Campylobacter TaxID=2593542 RepID=UPI0022E9A6C4|nr:MULTISPECIES: hypothetical protein [unclassified Campylobacter]MDA3043664.1 hypothetical protein [Campylobacter sp. JMF_09 ED2]MDA3045404.1 hypothetical protein [Campylobacter sp. JMF_07 ED4]MDA3064570.1 hypothetical protein [Campylobacter sp. JMF_11 EL3]MDA3072479.1 hypothetical protein [Campylobacter sp. VBCF_03 NA9]MDA3075532.1 hypothetical protein [Campylobacter sp. JMF_05 ED3]
MSDKKQNKKAILAIRGSKYSTTLILESLIRGEKITNHELDKFHTNSVKDIIYSLRKNYGLEIADIRVKNELSKSYHKRYFLDPKNKRAINRAKGILDYLRKAKGAVNLCEDLFR